MDYRELQEYQRSLLKQALAEGARRNEEQIKTWANHRDAHKRVIKGLETLPQELTTNCMVPIGKRALMKGKLAHTNEIMVCLGEGYFAKYSARQAIGVCERRVKQADEMLSNLEKERNLLEMRQTIPLDNEAFGDEGRREIIEQYDEAKEKEWRVQHRQREKEYRQKLAELRKQEKTEIETEEDLWRRLDELELQEELDEHIDRIREDDCNYYGEDLKEGEVYYESEEYESSDEDETTREMLERELAKLKQDRLPNDQTVALKENASETHSVNNGLSEDNMKERMKMSGNQRDSSESSIVPISSAETESKDLIPSTSDESDDRRNVKFDKYQDYAYLQTAEDSLQGLIEKNGFNSTGLNVEEKKQKVNTRRRVSFVDAAGSANDDNSEFENSELDDQSVFSPQQSVPIDRITQGSREESEDDDIVRIDFSHSKNNHDIPVGPGETIENPRDIYRVFCKPKSILKRSPTDMNYFHDIPPPADDSTDEEFPETESGGSTYTMVVKDIQERKPDVQKEQQLASADKRPVSRFKMARSGLKK